MDRNEDRGDLRFDETAGTVLAVRGGPHGPGRDKGEFFLLVQTRENRLAVVSFSTHEFGGVMFWFRLQPLAPLKR